MTGKEFTERIDSILHSRNQSRKSITQDLGISSSTMSSWAAGRGSIPNVNIAYSIAQYLNVSIEWLITGHDPDGLTESDRELLNMYHLLDERDKEDVRGIIEGKLERSMSRQGEGTEKSGLVG